VISPGLLIKTWLLTDSVAGVDITNPLLPLLLDLFVSGAPFPNDDPNRVYVGHLPQGFDVTFGPDLGLTSFSFGCRCHPRFHSGR